MSVRQSLLAILCQGPCYGYQLRAELARRTGRARSVNVGQIYHTLERLERDGLAAKGDTDEHGHVYYAVTEAGRNVVATWLASPSPPAATARDDLALKVALAATLPGVDAPGVVRAERAAAAAELERLGGLAPDAGSDAEGFAASIVHEAEVSAVRARLDWLDGVSARMTRHPRLDRELALSDERPRRGRPARLS